MKRSLYKTISLSCRYLRLKLNNKIIISAVVSTRLYNCVTSQHRQTRIHISSILNWQNAKKNKIEANNNREWGTKHITINQQDFLFSIFFFFLSFYSSIFYYFLLIRSCVDFNDDAIINSLELTNEWKSPNRRQIISAFSIMLMLMFVRFIIRSAVLADLFLCDFCKKKLWNDFVVLWTIAMRARKQPKDENFLTFSWVHFYCRNRTTFSNDWNNNPKIICFNECRQTAISAFSVAV